MTTLGRPHNGRSKMKILIHLLFFSAFIQSTQAQDVCADLEGAEIIAQDLENTYLGKIDQKFSSKSIFNIFGKYGRVTSGYSIWNETALFGTPHHLFSPFNEQSHSPPMLVKRGTIIGYLSTNKDIQFTVNPYVLKAMCEDRF